MRNHLTTASIVFAGGTYAEFRSFADILKLQIMSEKTFYKLQKTFVYPVINIVYKRYRDSLVEDCKNKSGIEVSGNGRCDSLGYNAKYCTYSIMDQSSSKILHFHIFNVAGTGTSAAMEKYGLMKVLHKIDSLGVNLDCSYNDR